jgi:hypothetical protein
MLDATSTPPAPSTLLPRVVTLVLVNADGAVLGALPPFEVQMPWWPEAWDVVLGARERYGVEVTLLRVLVTETGATAGGQVTYLAEARAAPSEVLPWTGELTDHPRRMPWARPGGPTAAVSWARAELASGGIHVAQAQQMRTWNLSTLWRLGTEGADYWLKVVPPFFGHEGRLLERLQGHPVPTLVAHDGPRILMADIPGDDLYDAPLPLLLEMVDQLVSIQQYWIGRTDELLALGLPDWRAVALARELVALVERLRGDLTAADQATLRRFVDTLEGRFTNIAAAGIPETLVHGDFHPGNHRGTAGWITLLDWGDSGVGHPLLDEPAFLERMDAAYAPAVRDRWHARWRAAVDGSHPERAAQLLEPVAAVRQALIYQRFLDNIEPSEHPYHADDPGQWLARAAALVRAEG